MNKIFKISLVFIFGIAIGYYINYINIIDDIFSSYYKAFQVGVYTNYDAAITYSSKYSNSIIVRDNELYRVYVSILKNKDNIESMSNYLDKLGIEYYLKEISVDNKEIKSKIDDYESLMNSESEIVFLELNKMIIDTYKESL